MFGDFSTADLIAYHCSRIDNQCRSELRPRRTGLPGTIKSERDYVTTLSTRIRDELSELYSCFAETIDQGTEMKQGVDGLILFRFKDEVKVGWYEAKWPRVLQADYRWDKVHDTRLASHFSEQVIKQRRWKDMLALWEMFFNEADDGYQSPPYAYFGSSCVWHDNAFEFIKKEGLIYKRWTTGSLKRMLTLHCNNFYSVIFDIISCRKGSRIKVSTYQNSIVIPDPKNPESNIEIPLPELPQENLKAIDLEGNQRIRGFMEKNNIAGYLHIDLNSRFRNHE